MILIDLINSVQKSLRPISKLTPITFVQLNNRHEGIKNFQTVSIQSIVTWL